MFLLAKRGKAMSLNFCHENKQDICQGYIRHQFYAIDTKEKEETVEDIPIVSEFKDVFLEELPRLPP